MQAMEQAMVSVGAGVGAGNGKGVGAGVGADVDAGVDAGEGTFIYHVHVGTPRLGSPCSPRRASNTRTLKSKTCVEHAPPVGKVKYHTMDLPCSLLEVEKNYTLIGAPC